MLGSSHALLSAYNHLSISSSFIPLLLYIDDNLITYELVDEHKEMDISIILSEDVGTFPKVEEIVITTSDNFNDIGIINNLLNMFS